MQNSLLMMLGALFGLTQCAEVQLDDTTTVEDVNVVGTWMEERTTYDTSGDTREWMSTHRKTIIVELVDNTLRFRNCLDDSAVTATVDGDQVTLDSADYPVMQLDATDTLVASESSDTAETVVTLHRFTTSTSTALAQLSLSKPRPLSTWSQLCLDSVVAATDANQFSFKAINDLYGATVGLTFDFADRLAEIGYVYPNADNQISGSFILPDTGAGSLSNPVGSVTVSKSTTMDFMADLTMTSSLDDSAIQVVGTLNVDPDWFVSE